MSKTTFISILKRTILMLTIMVCISCSKKEVYPSFDITQVQIHNNPSSALTARVVVTLNMPSAIQVDCYTQDGDLIVSTNSSIHKKHQISLIKLKEKTDYTVKVTLLNDNSEKEQTVTKQFTSSSIPSWVTDFYQPKLNTINDPLNDYYLFASMGNPGCSYIINSKGEIVWYQTVDATVKSVQMTDRGSILAILDQNSTNFGDGNIVLETSLSGDTLFYLEHGKKGFDKIVHHDLAINPQKNITAITNTFKDGLPGDGLVQWSSSGNKIWEWSTFDVSHEINPELKEQPWINSLFIDQDGHYIISLRAINQVWKVHSSSGKVLWKLGENGDIQINEPIYFQRQHYAYRNRNGHIMLFDNGSEKRPYSRVLAYAIDESNLTAKLISTTDLPKENYSPIMGSSFLLPDNNLLVASSSSLTALKIDQNGKVLFQLKFKSPIYRIEYVPSHLFK